MQLGLETELFSNVTMFGLTVQFHQELICSALTFGRNLGMMKAQNNFNY